MQVGFRDYRRPGMFCQGIGSPIAILIYLVLFGSILLQSCTGKSRAKFTSPSGASIVEVFESCTFVDCVVSVWVEPSFGRRLVPIRNDCYVRFAVAGWSKDERQVGIYVDGSYCGVIKAGISLEDGSAIAYEKVVPFLSDALVREYGLSSESLRPFDGNPLLWAGMDERDSSDLAALAFQMRFGKQAR